MCNGRLLGTGKRPPTVRAKIADSRALCVTAVVTGTSINMIFALNDTNDGPDYLLHRDNVRSAVFGVAFGGFSTILALLFILTHYNLVDCCCSFLTEGGWVEMAAILLLILLWIVGTAVLTQYGGLAATIIGSGADALRQQQQRSNPTSPSSAPQAAVSLEQLIQQAVSANTSVHNATVGNSSNFTMESGNVSAQEECILQIQNVSYACSDIFNFTMNTTTPTYVQPHPVQIIPGSNLYVAVWICLLASLNLAFRWKAQQALQFAQAQQEKAFAYPHNKDEVAPDGADTRTGQDNDRDDEGDDMEQFDDD
jgi:hypothetical protein